MKNLIGISTLLITLFACSSPKNTPKQNVDRMEFTVTHIQNEKDGQTISMTDDRGGRYITVISIPNGNYIDLAVGNKISLIAEEILESDPAQVISKNIEIIDPQATPSVNTIITTDKVTYTIGEPIALTMTIENTGKTAYTFLDWGTPLEERFTNNCMLITKGDKTIPYTGIMVKRMAPTEADYTTLMSGEKASGSIGLLNGYKITEPGTYNIQFKETYPNIPASNVIKIIIE